VRWTAALCLLSATPAAADPPYPATLPDFSRVPPDAYGLFSPLGGTTERPVLVIITEFDGAPAPPGAEATVAARYFGESGARGWFRDQSFGRLALSPAAETVGAADGVVRVNVGDARNYYSPPDIVESNPGVLDMRRSARRNKVSIQAAADAGVDFSRFDRDGNDDGVVDDLELIVVNVTIRPSGKFPGSAANRGHEAILGSADRRTGPPTVSAGGRARTRRSTSAGSTP